MYELDKLATPLGLPYKQLLFGEAIAREWELRVSYRKLPNLV
jgi:hypothetical protein